MPGGDRTGPAGLGPRTGRAAGYCAGFAHPGYTAGWFGCGRHGGGGLGYRNFRGGFGGFPNAPALSEEEFLKNRETQLLQELDIIRKRMGSDTDK